MTFWAALWWEFVIFFVNRDTTITNSTEMTASTRVALFLLRLNRILRKIQSLENQTWPTSNPTRMVQWYDEILVCMFRIHRVTL